MLRRMLRAVAHQGEGHWTPVDDFDRVSDLIALGTTLVWAMADLDDLTPANSERIGVELGLNPLALEDAMRPRQRPKLEIYENHLFAVAHQLDVVESQLEARQIACFVGKRFVLTIHQGAERTLTEALARLSRLSARDDRGPSVVMQAILDAVVDDYEATADRLELEIETLEEMVLSDVPSPSQERLYAVKQQIARLRRYVVPGERMLADVLAGHMPGVAGTTREHFRDIHDHLLRIGDQIRNIEDLTNAVVEFQRAEQTNALNEVTKRLTGWAAIIAIPTLIASIYGMNFPLHPANNRSEGFWIVLAMMVASSTVLYVYFKRRSWI